MVSKKVVFIGVMITMLVSGCVRPTKPMEEVWAAPASTSLPTAPGPIGSLKSTPTQYIHKLGEPIQTPTPDPAHPLPTPRLEELQYEVQQGDALGRIAQRYGVTLKALMQVNAIENADLLEVGQELTIPAQEIGLPGSGFKIIPDSELVYSPTSASFDIYSFVKSFPAYLTAYREEVDGERMGGAAIVERVAQEFSVNPRLLLAVLEYQSGWLTHSEPSKDTLDYPMGVFETWRKGLYNQLSWAANNLNRGYYLWRVNATRSWVLTDGTVVAIDPTINAGTAGVQGMYASLFEWNGWNRAVTGDGLFKVYYELFGYPFDYALEPLLPDSLVQPEMQLPFEPAAVWAFTGGPHGGWGSGSAWAGLDFAPPGGALGCVQSEAWVVAVADGLIVHSNNGAVVQDLDGDGLEQTGWSVLYMHIEGRERVAEGTYVQAGEHIGHPSCEGGVSSGTHVHLARRYNGEWLPADQVVPFVLDGWTSQGNGIEYDGYLVRDGETVEAWEGNFPINQIQR